MEDTIQKAIPEGMLVQAKLASVRTAVVEVLKQKSFNERLMGTLIERPVSFSFFEKSCAQLREAALTLHTATGELDHESLSAVLGSVPILDQLLSVKGLFRMALELFTWWSVYSPNPFFDPFMDKPDSEQNASLRILCLSGGILLSCLVHYNLAGNERLRMLLWKSPLFLKALKAIVTKFRPIREGTTSKGKELENVIGILMDLVADLNGGPSPELPYGIAEGRVKSLNRCNPTGVEGGDGPIDITHLVRAVTWLDQSRMSLAGYFKCGLGVLKSIALKDQYRHARENALSDSETNPDVLRLFFSALFDFPEDKETEEKMKCREGPEGLVAALQPLAEECASSCSFETDPAECDKGCDFRVEIIRFTLCNPAVAEHVNARMSCVLTHLRMSHKFLRRAVGGQRSPFFYVFMAWLEANATDGPDTPILSTGVYDAWRKRF
eukprot:Cvel_27926.t1-p1 / transcript=Cvel_27926.t1 / gene=Cvel_27926 / organism=Chromera_velia_CCMP2878 / gene_product=hypothetical protein / transcript_product=hypothetical protein / location=Cvel_scaffold3561:2422-3737(-) / protein_length=438 / sequence_SO=supercontig / SO=protein_coding / is_pseudo=false